MSRPDKNVKHQPKFIKMKKSYFFLNALFLSGLFINNVYSQEAYVAGNAKVKINPNTLVYFGDGLTLKNEVNQANVVENAGNIIIQSGFTNAGAADGADGKNFISTWTNAANYGQVIIQQDVSTTSKLTMEKGAIDPSIFTWGQFAIPYAFDSPNEAMLALFGNPFTGSSRYYSSLMKWDNLQKPEFDQLTPAGTGATGLNPGDYVILNLTYYSGGIKQQMMDAFNGSGKLAYSGAPTNQLINQSFAAEIYPDTDTAWNTWKEQKNSYNERYKTYISDDVREGTTDNYGRYFFQFGNPYTSNIDLSYIGTDTETVNDGIKIDKLMSVSKIGSEEWSFESGSTVVSSVRAIWNGSSWSGNPEALVIKPFETFILGLYHDADRTTYNFDFNDNLKTFESVPGVGGFAGNTTVNDKMNTGTLVMAFDPTSATKHVFYQLGLRLYDADDNYTNNEVYVVVGAVNKVQNGTNDKYESEYADFDNRTGFYLAQENADGSEVTSTDRKLYINAVNTQYEAKPIQLFFNRKANDSEGYYVKSSLFYGDIFHQLDSEDLNFYGNNSYYFYDKTDDILLPIDTEFSYYIEPSSNSLESRYQVFWNGGPQQNKLNVEEKILPGSQTFVYKNQEKQMVRFSDEFSTAEIKVYDLSGRNILTHTNVKTDLDFELNLPAKGVYVVKILSDTGVTYTQKIIY